MSFHSPHTEMQWQQLAVLSLSFLSLSFSSCSVWVWVHVYLFMSSRAGWGLKKTRTIMSLLLSAHLVSSYPISSPLRSCLLLSSPLGHLSCSDLWPRLLTQEVGEAQKPPRACSWNSLTALGVGKEQCHRNISLTAALLKHTQEDVSTTYTLLLLNIKL